jgi:hypothetical protein
MLSNSHHYIRPAAEVERAYLESLIRRDYEECHPGENFDDMKRRSAFSKEDKGLLRDWMALATQRAATEQSIALFKSAAK